MASNVLIGAASQVKSQFSILKEVDSSNTVFKLFSKVTVGLCVIASILEASSEYFGKPIICQNSAGQVAVMFSMLFVGFMEAKKFQRHWLMFSSATHTSMKL